MFVCLDDMHRKAPFTTKSPVALLTWEWEILNYYVCYKLNDQCQ